MRKTSIIFILAGMALLAQDPTRPSAQMADHLRVRALDAQNLRVRALVVGSAGEGVALIGKNSREATTVRKGARLSEQVDGVTVTMTVKGVTPSGVELETSDSTNRLFLAGSFSPLAAPTNTQAEFIRHLEATDVPLDMLLRLISDQSGVNISSSDATAKKNVSIFLRNVTAETSVEEICRTAGLWFRRESNSGVLRVTTMAEYEENLNTFREESTELFTLLYPNVVEVAGVIYGLHPDRTFLSLGEEELDEDDENDLSRRFRRFRVLEDNGGSQFLDMEPPTTSGSGRSSGSGNFSFSRGSALSRITQWDQLRRRARGEGTFGSRSDKVSADDAKLMEFAWKSGNTNLLQVVRNQITPSAANIFVTLSRKNNMLAVRTSDLKVMDEIRSLVKKLDVPTPMVLLEVKVLELNITDDYEAGFTWTLTSPDRGAGRATHALGHDADALRNLTAQALQTGMTAVNPTLQFGVVSDWVSAQIQLMEKDGKVKTLATPTLLVANNEVSRIFSGKEYPLVSGWTAGGAVLTDGGTEKVDSTVELEKKDVGTMLLLTPNINADRTVTIRMLQENSEVSAQKVDIPVKGSSSSEGDVRSIEYVESRQLVGTFVAKDGMMSMAGGLIRESDEVTYWRTPVLGSIPLLGWLFRGTEKSKVRTELVVLIRPHVISTPMEGGKISKELLDAISAHPARDGRGSMMIHKAKDGKDDVERPRTPDKDVEAIVK